MKCVWYHGPLYHPVSSRHNDWSEFLTFSEEADADTVTLAKI